MKLWGYNAADRYARADEIIAAITKLNLPEDFSIVDIACGDGGVLNKVKEAFPQCKAFGFDIEPPPEAVNVTQGDLQDFIKDNHNHYDIVMMLNSYRNWHGKAKLDFDEWCSFHTHYFITSLKGRQIGIDTHDFPLMLLDMSGMDV